MDRLAAGADPERVIQELKDANIPLSRIRDIVGDASGNLIRRDYYEVLSISRTATSEEIKRAFRRTALQVHPDRNINPGAAERFKQINAIYQTLSDPQKRTEYDRSLRNTSGSSEQSRQAGGGSNTQRSRAGTANRDKNRQRGSTPVTYGMRRMAAALVLEGHEPDEIVERLVGLGVSESNAQMLVEDVSWQERQESSGARQDTSSGNGDKDGRATEKDELIATWQDDSIFYDLINEEYIENLIAVESGGLSRPDAIQMGLRLYIEEGGFRDEIIKALATCLFNKEQVVHKFVDEGRNQTFAKEVAEEMLQMIRRERYICYMVCLKYLYAGGTQPDLVKKLDELGFSLSDAKNILLETVYIMQKTSETRQRWAFGTLVMVVFIIGLAIYFVSR